MDKEVLFRLEYLDLEYHSSRKRKETVDNKHFYCFTDAKFMHIFHSDNHHLNTITDLSFQLLNNQSYLSKSYDTIIKNFLNLMQKQNHKIDELYKNILLIHERLDMVKQIKTSTIPPNNLLNDVKIEVDKLNKLATYLDEKINKIIG